VALRLRAGLTFAGGVVVGFVLGYRFYRDNVAPDYSSEPCEATGAALGGIERRRDTCC
jgi:hypothetical protein